MNRVIALAMAMAIIAGMAVPVAAQDPRRADDLYAKVARNPEDSAAFEAYLATLQVWKTPLGGRSQTTYIFGDTLLTRAEIRRQFRFANEALKDDPCKGAVDAAGKPQSDTALDECLVRQPRVAMPGGGKAYVFHVSESEAERLLAAARRVVEQSRLPGASSVGPASIRGLEPVLADGTTVYVVYARCDDARRSCDEVAAVLKATGRAGRGGGRLAVHAVNGNRVFWEKDYRRLRFAVLRNSFPDQRAYLETIAAIKTAARDWNGACDDCGVEFVYAQEFDGLDYFDEFLVLAEKDRQQQGDGLRFVVIYQPSAGNLVALAFLPDTPANRRVLYVTPTFFNLAPDSVGRQRTVMQHELGHILGYRHEHIRVFKDGTKLDGTCLPEPDMRQDLDWRAATAYDDQSVMHYDCKAGGVPKRMLSMLDKAGHRKTYGAQANEVVAPSPVAIAPPEQPSPLASTPGATKTAVATSAPKADLPRSYSQCRSECRKANPRKNEWFCSETCTCRVLCDAQSDANSCDAFCSFGN